MSPRPLSTQALCLAGLEPFVLDHTTLFVNVGERTNVTGSKAFARMVLVFNCDENLDYRSMGRIFIGLVKCGAWGCFDEFNRLVEEQLSAISQ